MTNTNTNTNTNMGSVGSVELLALLRAQVAAIPELDTKNPVDTEEGQKALLGYAVLVKELAGRLFSTMVTEAGWTYHTTTGGLLKYAVPGKVDDIIDILDREGVDTEDESDPQIEELMDRGVCLGVQLVG